MENRNAKNDLVMQRMYLSAYAKTYPHFMGGTKIGVDDHATRRSRGRFYERMNPQLLTENIYDMLSEIPTLEDDLMDLNAGDHFVVYREKDGLVLFCSFGMDGDSILVFVNTVIVFDKRNSYSKIFVDPEDELRIKICNDGSIDTNAPEFADK